MNLYNTILYVPFLKLPPEQTLIKLFAKLLTKRFTKLFIKLFTKPS